MGQGLIMADDKTELMNQLSKAYSDPEIKQNPKLSVLILQLAEALDNGSSSQDVCETTCAYIAYYGISHREKLPKTAVNLYNYCKSRRIKYSGIMRADFFNTSWFSIR